MNQLNQGPSSPSLSELPMNRKRGRPRKDESLAQHEKTPITPEPDNTCNENAAAITSDGMVGQVVSGMIESSFDAGYFLNVNVNGTNKQLRGVVFLPGRVAPITAANDVAPHAKMYKREEIVVPCPNQHTQLQVSVSETNFQQPDGFNLQLSKASDEIHSSELHSGILMTDKTSCPDSHSRKVPVTVAELHSGILIADKNQNADKNEPDSGTMLLHNNLQVKEMGTRFELHSGISVADKNRSTSGTILPDNLQNEVTGNLLGEKIPLQQISDSGPESQPLSLMPESEENDFSKGDEPKKESETSAEEKLHVADARAPKESDFQAASFVDFFPGPEILNRETGFNPDSNQELVHNDIRISETNQNKAPVNFMKDKPASAMGSMQENLRLELGSKFMSGDITSQTINGSQNKINGANSQPASLRGFLANLFEGEGVANEPKPAASESAFQSSVVPQADGTTSATNNVVDYPKEDAIPQAQSQNQVVLDSLN